VRVDDNFRESNCFIIGLHPMNFRNKNNASAIERSMELSNQLKNGENSCNIGGERLLTNESQVQKAASKHKRIKNSIHGHSFNAGSKYSTKKIQTQEEALEMFSHPNIRLSKKVTGYMDMGAPASEKLFLKKQSVGPSQMWTPKEQASPKLASESTEPIELEPGRSNHAGTLRMTKSQTFLNKNASHEKKTLVINKQLNFYPTNVGEDISPRGKCTIGPDSYYLVNSNNTSKGPGYGKKRVLEFIQNKSKKKFTQ
jgi:hypothetical protein